MKVTERQERWRDYRNPKHGEKCRQKCCEISAPCGVRLTCDCIQSQANATFANLIYTYAHG